MVNQVASALVEESFTEGQYVITQGEEGDKFYIIAEGAVKCTSTKEGGAEIDLITLKDGDYFGEMALMLNEPRHANCIAVNGGNAKPAPDGRLTAHSHAHRPQNHARLFLSCDHFRCCRCSCSCSCCGVRRPSAFKAP
jgi:hypothetical protein